MTTLRTAGHIDHGKTALVRALTGVDTDRLPEERERGISIALGYALLVLPPGRRLSVVDVPGHERFVRTMVAGATGIDLYLMTVAADDSVMPQTREHAAVLAALGVDVGVVRSPSATSRTRGARAEAAALLLGAEAMAVSARTGAGLDELRAALDRAAAPPSRADAAGGLRLHVDRVFTVHGVGTVVTGTLPRRDAAGSGGSSHDDVDPVVTYRVDAALSWATPESRPDGGARVAVHHGTREVPGGSSSSAGGSSSCGSSSRSLPCAATGS